MNNDNSAQRLGGPDAPHVGYNSDGSSITQSQFMTEELQKSKLNETPRTEIYVLNPLPEVVPADFARELERELNKAQKKAAKYDKLVEGETQTWSQTCTNHTDVERNLIGCPVCARKEAVKWKSNHDNQVNLKRVLTDRPDLKERSQSMQRLLAEIDELVQEVESWKHKYEELVCWVMDL